MTENGKWSENVAKSQLLYTTYVMFIIIFLTSLLYTTNIIFIILIYTPIIFMIICSICVRSEGYLQKIKQKWTPFQQRIWARQKSILVPGLLRTNFFYKIWNGAYELEIAAHVQLYRLGDLYRHGLVAAMAEKIRIPYGYPG